MKKHFLHKLYNLSLAGIVKKVAGNRLYTIPRFTPGTIKLLGKHITYADGPSYLFMKSEIFDKEIYKFTSDKTAPVIIDCGANIGLSVMYFKQLFPNAIVTALEPDPGIYAILKSNIEMFGYKDVELIERAVWSEETTLQFFSEGADGGHIASEKDSLQKTKVQTVKLSQYLDREVDFLKIDIEGAETEVLSEAKHVLNNVKNLFVEYHSFEHKKQDLDRILAMLSEAGFRYYIHDIGIKSEHPFYKKDVYNTFDMQLNIFACRF